MIINQDTVSNSKSTTTETQEASIVFVYLSLSHDGIQIARLALDDALNLRRHPAAVEIAWLRLHALAVDGTVPRAGVEAQVPANGLEAGGRAVVRPYAVGDGAVWEGDAVVRCGAFPLAPTGAGRGFEGGFDAGRGKIVC